MRNKKISKILAATITAATVFGGVSAGVSNAKGLPASIVKSVEITNKDGEPISGNVDNESLKKSGFVMKIRVEFPDDAKPGDHIIFDMNMPVNFSSSNMTLTNEEGVDIADLVIYTGKSEGVTKFFYTLLDSAEDLVNRSADLVVSVSENPIVCDPISAKKNQKVSITKGDEVIPLSNSFSFDREKCASTSISYPTPRGVTPTPRVGCYAEMSARYSDSMTNSYYTKPGQESTIENIVDINSLGTLTVSPGGTKDPWFNALTFTYDGSVSKDQFTFLEDGDTSKFKDEFGIPSYLTLNGVPAIFEEYENKEEGVTSDTQNAKEKYPIPKNYLFPDAELANKYKEKIIAEFGEDYYYNNNDAFAKSKKKSSSAGTASRELSKWIGKKLGYKKIQ